MHAPIFLIFKIKIFYFIRHFFFFFLEEMSNNYTITDNGF